ncbi:MAG: helix-turn-helix domain-containing protein [Gemmatimonadales bacterium]
MAVIGEAIEAKAGGDGHRRIATRLGVPAWRVRRWLRRFAERAVEIREHFCRWAHALDVSVGPASPGGDVFVEALEAIGVAARAAVLRLGPRPAWPWASFASGGVLLANTKCPLPPVP